MTRRAKAAGVVVLAIALGGLALLGWMLHHGFSARDEPSAAEAFLARRMRHLAVPSAARAAKNPIPPGPEVLAQARAHFADHCALCHDNDGSGRTELGRNLYPKAPDMRAAPTQSLSDGELFYIITNGIRLTGMPAWGGGGEEDAAETWKLVHLIRRLPQITPGEIEEMKKLNPRSPRDLQEEEEQRRFLEGEASPGPSAGPPMKHH